MIYTTPPPLDFIKQIDVVGCFVICGDKFVLLRRQSHKANGDKWGLPAGKVDAGESLSQAMIRELAEETGIPVVENQLKFFSSVHVRHNGFDLDWHMFSITLSTMPKVTINPYEHQNFIWVSPAEALNIDLIHDLDECIKLYYKER